MPELNCCVISRSLPRLSGGTAAESLAAQQLTTSPLNFDVRADYFKLSDSRVLTAFTIQTENKDLVFENSGGLQTARLNIFGKIVTVTDRRVGAFEDSVTTSATVAELTEAKERKSAYSKAVVLEPGRYRADVIVRDVVSGATGVRQFAFQVPKYEDGKLATSSMILAAKLENMEHGLAAGPFMIGQTKVIPNMTGLYHRGSQSVFICSFTMPESIRRRCGLQSMLSIYYRRMVRRLVSRRKIGAV